MSNEEKIITKTFTTLVSRPDAALFGVGKCRILDTGVTYECDGVEWTPADGNVLTWATKPTAAAFGRGQAWFSDIGAMGYSDGVEWIIGDNIITIGDIAELATINDQPNQSVFVKDSMRGGVFNWSATGTANGGTVFAGLTGYWVRQFTGPTSIEWFGAENDDTGVIDSTVAIQAACDFLPIGANDGINSPLLYTTGGEIRLGPGTFKISSTINLRRGVTLVGAGSESTKILSFTPGSPFKYADAGKATPDAIVFKHLHIHQDISVLATSGAGIEVNAGPASVDAASLTVNNVLISGTYQGILLEAGIANSFDSVTITDTESHGVNISNLSLLSTSTALNCVYVFGCAGDGFRFTGTDYFSLVSCASDSNGGYGYYFDSTSNCQMHGGTEACVAGAMYLKNTRSMNMHVRVVGASGAAHGISLENAAGTKLSGTWSANASQTGYAVQVVTNGGLVEIDNFNLSGVWATNFVNTVEHIKVTRPNLPNKFIGGAQSNWAFGKDSGVAINTAQLFVSGVAETTTQHGVKINPAFTASSATNAALSVTNRCNAGAVTYPIMVGVGIDNATIGAGNSVARVNGLYIADQSGGSSASSNVALGTATPAVGTWNIYSASTRDNVWLGKQRYLSSTGPTDSYGTGSPEGVLTAPIGSRYGRTDGGAGTSFYVKESGTGNTGWVGK